MTYRVGLIGCGWMAPYQVAAWRLLRNAEVAAVCDRDLGRAGALASRFDIGWHGDDPQRMLDSIDVQIVDIVTPPDSHKPLALAAMGRGRHVLCQKPLAPTIADAQEMIAAARRHGVALYVNEMLRYCDWFVKAAELIKRGAIGRPVYAHFRCRTAGFLEVGPERRMSYGFREFLRKTGRVITLEETIHYFDIARYLLGWPCSIYAAMQRVSPVLCGEDTVAAILRYADTIVVIEDSWSAHGPERLGMEIEGTDGAILMSSNMVLELYSGRTGSKEASWDFGGVPWPEQRAGVFAALFRDFLSSIEGLADRTAQASDNLNTLRLTLAAYESAERHAEVDL